ncbi:MAG TPA: response regulator [Myxococcaceae bacterium]|nr:response regulator [Myxococcaceae bacterium]
MNILLVDDDADLCKLLSRYLERNGCTVFAASHPLQALTVLEREQVGMVITDLMMPHVDGIGFTAQLKADPRYKDVPVVMMTANSDSEVMERGLRTGVAMTLTKPFEFSELLNIVRFAQ